MNDPEAARKRSEGLTRATVGTPQCPMNGIPNGAASGKAERANGKAIGGTAREAA